MKYIIMRPRIITSEIEVPKYKSGILSKVEIFSNYNSKNVFEENVENVEIKDFLDIINSYGNMSKEDVKKIKGVFNSLNFAERQEATCAGIVADRCPISEIADQVYVKSNGMLDLPPDARFIRTKKSQEKNYINSIYAKPENLLEMNSSHTIEMRGWKYKSSMTCQEKIQMTSQEDIRKVGKIIFDMENYGDERESEANIIHAFSNNTISSNRELEEKCRNAVENLL